MAATLTITDLADGTGATATIAGTDAGSTNTVYVIDPRASAAWASGGSRTGDGAVTLALEPGYYFAYLAASLVSGVPAVSTVTPLFAVTSGDETLQERILDAVASGIRTLAPTGLPGIPVGQVYRRLSLDPSLAGITLPAVVVTAQDSERFSGGTNKRDDVGRPAVVQILHRNSGDYVTPEGQFLLWRDRIIKYFISQRLPGVSGIGTCTVEPGPIFDPSLPAYQQIVSAFTLRFQTREARGT